MTATTIRVQMAQRKDTAANWTAANPILLSGEIGYETDTKKFKIGNGTTNWNSLAYLPIPDGSGNLTITGNLEIGSTGSLTFEGSTADGFETTLAVTNPTADRTITLPNQSGTVLVSGNASIVDADIAANAEIAVSKLADGTARQLLQTDAAGTGVEWASNIDVPGTLDVTSTATFDSIAQYPLGSAGAPTITFTGDNNTGIYSPGADQVAISTGGTGRLFVDSSGNVKIGNSASVGILNVRAATNGNLHFRDIATVVGSGTGVVLDVLNDDSTTVQDLAFRGATTIFRNASSETLRITSAGLVGVGTSSPLAKLDVANTHAYGTAAQDVIKITPNFSGGSSASASSAGSILWGYNDGTTNLGRINVVSNQPSTTLASSMQFWIHNGSSFAQAATLTPTGLGIGTTSPDAILNTEGGNVRISGTRTAGSFLDISPNNTGSNGVNLGVSYYGAGSYGPLNFLTGGTERARIDSSGRLLVGTSSARSIDYWGTPRQQFEGLSYEQAGLLLYANSAGDGFGSYLALGKSRGSATGSNTVVQANDELGHVLFYGSDGSNEIRGAQITAFADGTPGTNDMPGRIVMSTTAAGASSPTERMRISSVGEFTFQSVTYGLRAQTGSTAGTTVQIYSGFHSASGIGTGTACYYVHSNGNVQNTNGSYTTISDAKLKENIVDAGSQWDDLKAIQIRNWNFKAETGHETHRQIGPIAQELETVCPGLVFDTPDRDKDGNETGEVTKGVNQSVLYMKAVKALQEAMERIETLEAKVAALESA